MRSVHLFAAIAIAQLILATSSCVTSAPGRDRTKTESIATFIPLEPSEQAVHILNIGIETGRHHHARAVELRDPLAPDRELDNWSLAVSPDGSRLVGRSHKMEGRLRRVDLPAVLLTYRVDAPAQAVVLVGSRQIDWNDSRIDYSIDSDGTVWAIESAPEDKVGQTLLRMSPDLSRVDTYAIETSTKGMRVVATRNSLRDGRLLVSIVPDGDASRVELVGYGILDFTTGRAVLRTLVEEFAVTDRLCTYFACFTTDDIESTGMRHHRSATPLAMRAAFQWERNHGQQARIDWKAHGAAAGYEGMPVIVNAWWSTDGKHLLIEVNEGSKWILMLPANKTERYLVDLDSSRCLLVPFARAMKAPPKKGDIPSFRR